MLGYQVDEVAAASRMASLGFRPDCHEFHLAVQENISELYSVSVLTDYKELKQRRRQHQRKRHLKI